MQKFNPSVNTIYVDMDGVVADFDAFVLKNLGRTFSHIVGPKGDSEMWDFLKSVDRLYYILDETSYARELMEMVADTGANVEFLTAIPRRTSIPGAQIDKQQWVTERFGDRFKMNIGPYSADKWKWAKPGDVLIDDRADNIEDWITKGQGNGILHKYDDFENTKRLFASL